MGRARRGTVTASPLTSRDIVTHEFHQALRGYAIGEVDDLLARLADQVDRSEQEVEELRRRLADAQARLERAEGAAAEFSARATPQHAPAATGQTPGSGSASGHAQPGRPGSPSR